MTVTLEDPRSLLDTNIVIHAYDQGDPAKHAVALEVLKRLARQGRLQHGRDIESMRFVNPILDASSD